MPKCITIKLYSFKLPKVTKKGAFPNENALLKLLFIRTKELEKKWSTGFIPNGSMVMNQFLLHNQIKDRVIKYLE
ncbi:hypothetical protein B5P37_07245 [Staphylococcus lutrae]|uniref:Uncharacterized protein n=1 Tax=Staphylococcus lutrae TaxID=155085 RepID=A0AAC9RT78_9STAP|nr:hypothetical protein B5P37_07245 [Staphylococcus lutrae]